VYLDKFSSTILKRFVRF